MALLKIKNGSNEWEILPTMTGLSAYEIAVKNGYSGTEAQWLTSLVGATGTSISSITKTSTSGVVDTYTIKFSDNTSTTYIITNGKNAYSPKIQDGNWWVFDDSTGSYVDSGTSVSSSYDLTKAKIEAVLTGDITSHNHDNEYDAKGAASTAKSEVIGTTSDTSTTTTIYGNKKYVDEQVAGKANVSHTHTKSQITDFPTSLPASDVYSWAKASTKPSYSQSEISNDDYTVKDASYVHTDSNFTATEKTKLSEIAEKAQVNVIESVQVNGTALSIASKTVNVAVPTAVSTLTNDSNYQTATQVTTSINNATASLASTSYVDGKVSSVYKPAGSSTFANLPTPSSSILGYVYNVTDSFTSTSSFVEGSGNTYPAGTNVVVVLNGTSYLFDVLAGFVDLSNYASKSVATTSANGLMSSSDKTKLDSGVGTSLGVSGTSVSLKNSAGTAISTITTQDTTYSAGTGISFNGTTINHSNSVTAGTASGTNAAVAFGGAISIPSITYDAQGHIKSVSTTSATLPANPNTDTLVTQTLSTTSSEYPLVLSSSVTTGTRTTLFGTKITANPSTGYLTATGFNGNAATATKLYTARTVGLSGVTATAQSFDGSANITIPITAVPSSLLSGTASINTTGSAATLTTARTIAISGGATGTATSFDGSANISIPVTSLDATKLTGTASINITGTATKATQDASGNVITSTYIPIVSNLTAQTSGLYKIATNSNGIVISTAAVAKSDITALGIPAQDTTYSVATTSTDGLLSSSDKTKLDNLITSGTTDLTAGTSSLETGKVYLVYE